MIIRKNLNDNNEKKDNIFNLKNNIQELNQKDIIKESINEKVFNKYAKKINSAYCICIYNKPYRKSPLKIESNNSFQLNMDIINFPLINIK